MDNTATLTPHRIILGANQQLALLKQKQWAQVSPVLDSLDIEAYVHSNTVFNQNVFKDYAYHARGFYSFLAGVSWLDMQDNMLSQYQEHLMQQEYRARTVNKKVIIAGKILEHLHSQGFLPSYRMPKPLRVSDQKKGFTPEEVCRIEKAITDPETTALFYLFSIEGFRKAEALALTVEDIHGNTIRLLGKGRYEKIDWQADAKTIAAIREHLEASDIHSGKIFRMDASTVNRRFAKILQKLGIHDKTVHGFRHYVATRLLDNGMHLRNVQLYLRHLSPQTTQQYDDARTTEKTTQEAHNILTITL